MKSVPPFFLFLLIILPIVTEIACGEKKKPVVDNDIDAARMFLLAMKDGKFNEANKLLVQDEHNINLLSKFSLGYEGERQDIKDQIANSSINIHEVTKLNDSTSLVDYSYSLSGGTHTLRMMRIRNKWLADLMYEMNKPANIKLSYPPDTIRQ